MSIFDGGSTVGALGAGVLGATYLATLHFTEDTGAFAGGLVGALFTVALPIVSQLGLIRAHFAVVRAGLLALHASHHLAWHARTFGEGKGFGALADSLHKLSRGVALHTLGIIGAVALQAAGNTALVEVELQNLVPNQAVLAAIASYANVAVFSPVVVPGVLY